MKPIVGIICEYDPFHRGHARQFALIRQQLPEAAILCVMSGPFTQRGMPALHPPAFRARAALAAGADIVLELPALFALREAQHFALGGVSILHRLGFVTHVSFGCESDDLSSLLQAARMLEHPTEDFLRALRAALDSGISFAAAQGAALGQALFQGKEGPNAGLFGAPNNILGISYLRALLRLHSPLQPLPVLREGSYHEKSLEAAGYPSATAVRAALLSGDFSKAEAACGYSFPPSPLCRPEALDAPLLYALRGQTAPQLALLPDCTEGLENRLFAACRQATTRTELLERLKTRRYTHTRLNRLCAHALLGVTAGLQAEALEPGYVRLLGFRRESETLLPLLKKSRVPVIAKAAHGPMEDAAYRLDLRAYDLWALGAEIPAGLMMTQPMQIV